MLHSIKKHAKIFVTTAVLVSTIACSAFAANVKATACVNVRKSASNSSSVVTVMDQGSVAKKLGTKGSWIKVKCSGKTGYVYKKYLKSTSAKASSNTKTKAESTSKTNSKKDTSSKTCLGTFRLTFYAGDTITACGRTPRVNHTIAADTSVIPMYTKVYIEDWGTFVVEDRGGAIKGKRIDVFVSSNKLAYKYGVQYKKVYICN